MIHRKKGDLKIEANRSRLHAIPKKTTPLAATEVLPLVLEGAAQLIEQILEQLRLTQY